MEQIDLKLKLFGGMPINIDGFGEIIPLTVKEIISFGYSDYISCLNLINLNLEDVFSNDNSEVDEDINVIDVLIASGDKAVERQLEKSLSLFLRGEAIIDKEEMCVYIRSLDGNSILVVDRKNYNKIQDIIRWQNYINHFEDKKMDSFNPADEEVRKFKEKMDKLKKERDRIKRKNSEGDDEQSDIDFYDIISSISSKSNSTNESDVLNLTIYQVYSKFKRLDIIDQYDVNIRSILAGADSKKIKLKHWSTKAD